jgi:conjugal transfer pilus assembly protein TraK
MRSKKVKGSIGKYILLCACWAGLTVVLFTATPYAQTTAVSRKCPNGSCSSAAQPGDLYSYADTDKGKQAQKSTPVAGTGPTLRPQQPQQQPKLPTGAANALAQKPAALVPHVTPPQKKQLAGQAALSGANSGILLPSVGYDQVVTDMQGGQMVVMPEIATQVAVSNSDVNRIICQGSEIKDVVFSKEKGLTVKIAGKNAFFKFHILKKDDEEVYISTPSELFISCGNNIYNIIAVPKRIPSQTISLSEGKMENIRKNAALFGGLPLEKKVIMLIKKTYRGEAATDFQVKKIAKQFNNIFEDVDVTLQNLVTVEGEGLRLKEYTVRVKAESKKDSVYIKEKDFLRADLASRAIAVAIDPLNLKKGETARAFVVELAGHAEEKN